MFRDTAVVATVLLPDPADAVASSTPTSAAPRPRRRGRRGGQGNRWPTTWAELRTRLEQRGCTVERRGTRSRVTLADGSRYVLPGHASDRRALANSATDLRARDVDVRAEPPGGRTAPASSGSHPS
ncbi:hypothetical protein ACPZ19_12050 [Amycolatopsis lurida]